jgi:serine phosphatase RsbU (regulator of sigma subunit)
MLEMPVKSSVKVPECFTDVLYMGSHKQMVPEIKKLLRQRRLSFLAVQMDEFPQILPYLDLIGTVIIDMIGFDTFQQQKLAGIIESLEMKNIGAILLNNRVSQPIKSFSMAAVKSFSMVDVMELVSVDDLWMRISVNLAYRKRSTGIVVKPAIPPKQSQQGTNKNKLAEQLRMTEALVDNLSEQLRMAGLVQRDFLPASLPNSERIRWATTFLPAEWVSGDIYDIARIDEQHIGFYVADVVGHGIPAALLTIFLKQALVMRETMVNNYRIFSPAEVMTNLNKRMATQKLSGYQFATCCYCLLNVNSLELTFARAGHPYPILIRDTEQPQQLEIRGSLLGIFEDAEYIEGKVQLQKGDKLLVYSDGAEGVVGCLGDHGGFQFGEGFCQIKDFSIVEMMDRMNKLVQNQKVTPAEIDDVTAVGLEIL